jgi:colicin import membrane protein
VQRILNQQQPGLKKFFTASVVLHVIVIAAGLFLMKGEPARILLAPSYTTVELVSAPAGRGAPAIRRAKRRAKKIPAVKSSSKKASKKTIIKKTIAKKKTSSKKVILRGDAKVKEQAKELDPISSAIAALESKADEEQEDELIARSIEAIAEREDAEDADVAREVAGLRAEILGGAVIDALSAQSSGSGGYGDAPLPGSAGAGSVNISQMDIEFIEYYNSVGSMIRSEWIFPGEKTPGLETTVAIKIGTDGKLLALRIERASGNTLFDNSAIKAVEKVGDFPPLPKNIKEEFLEIGIRFCPGGCAQ